MHINICWMIVFFRQLHLPAVADLFHTHKFHYSTVQLHSELSEWNCWSEFVRNAWKEAKSECMMCKHIWYTCMSLNTQMLQWNKCFFCCSLPSCCLSDLSSTALHNTLWLICLVKSLLLNWYDVTRPVRPQAFHLPQSESRSAAASGRVAFPVGPGLSSPPSYTRRHRPGSPHLFSGSSPRTALR